MPLDAGFRAMLTTEATVEQVTGKDKWGNEQRALPIPLDCFVVSQVFRLGAEDNEQEEGKTVVEMQIITDAYGAQIGDEITVQGTTVYVNAIDTPKDEVGIDLMHTLTASTTQEG